MNNSYRSVVGLGTTTTTHGPLLHNALHNTLNLNNHLRRSLGSFTDQALVAEDPVLLVTMPVSDQDHVFTCPHSVIADQGWTKRHASFSSTVIRVALTPVNVRVNCSWQVAPPFVSQPLDHRRLECFSAAVLWFNEACIIFSCR